MKTPTVLGLYGYSGSGKTTLIEQIIDYLSQEDYHIAAIKKTPKSYTMDTPGSDTWKYAHAGASPVVFLTGVESSFILKKQATIKETIDHINAFDDVDVILIEGSMDGSYPQIRVDASKPELNNTVYTYDGDINKLIGFIKKRIQRVDIMGQSIELKVNGKRIPLTEFPKDVIKSTILGMISSLKGVDDIDEVSIQISMKKTEE